MRQAWQIDNTPQTKQQKQIFLRQQVIDTGYDPEQFIQFLNHQLDIQSDLNQCTMAQLQDVVSLYKKKKNNQSQDLSSYFSEREVSGIDQPLPICQKSLSQPQLITIRTNPELTIEQYKNTVKCIKITDKFQHTKNIFCQVKNPERKYLGGILGIGGRSFLCFEVWAFGINNDFVYRRYSDFVWLRATLVKFYPSLIIPPIPNKKAHKRLPHQITKRMSILTMFLNDITKMPILLNNKYLQGFLTIKQHNKFELLKQQADKKHPYQSMLSAESLSGTLHLSLTSCNYRYKQGLHKFISEAQHLYKQITRNSKKIRNLTIQKINILYQMGNQFAELYSISQKFNMYVSTDAIQKLKQIYGILNNMMVEWGNSLKKEVEEVERAVSTFFKFVREEFVGFREILAKVQACEDLWIKDKDLLDKQKQKIFKLQDPKKWQIPKKIFENLPKSAILDRSQAFKIMLPKKSVQLESLKENYAFYISQLYEHANNNFHRCSQRFCDNFGEFTIKMKVSNQEIGAMWTEMSYKFSDPYKKKAVVQIMQLQKPQQPDAQNYDD